ncbi:acetate/propionate family kinase [Photobacterium damselae]|uniref:Acetate kinase n=3 Tax=Photobacterium damselae TaxID=38293 RepID=D0Z3V8_PHODD|nr:acetate/propionate family kinase [Photobacterium damselae]EEZ40089.1 acetate kinase [Photobacterium damselae subsp. damselae CIP 102761]ELV7516567.1 acetate/propionate family kinase [Photobacterium damselae]ELV7518916.1 acetate/propionate family kinase [Photobacterium damselae]KAB1181172.1 acetate/propionate family kinase [Photobacterium damselae subsp. damselae]KAB1182454.1 acetate/propionate family kinase [Photobacterium damselae subsp. damselae]
MSNSLVLVINSGSSSLKFALIDTVTGDAMLNGLGECFFLPEAVVSWKVNGEKHEYKLSGLENHHQQAIDRIVALVDELGLKEDIVAIGHRVVHGGTKFSHTVKVDEQVMADIEALSDLAPLHNPAHVIGMRAAAKAFPTLSQYAVFDTAFHQTMPEKAFTYAISKEVSKEYDIRRYGAHGTSHYYVTREAAKVVNKPVEASSFISVHLGNGASVCVVKNGESIDTSMGFTPLAGLMMGTRCGDIDPSVLEYLLKKGWTPEQLHDLLVKKSGFLGISGITSDCRGIIEAMEQGNHDAKLAFEVFTYRAAKYIASYMVALDELDGIIFTGGIGENSMPVRSEILRLLKIFGYREDEQANADARFGNSGVITQANTPLAMVIPTNEEWVIANESMALLHA